MDNIEIPAQFKWLAKMGYCARGAIYLVIGGLGIMAAIGNGGETTGSKGAILAIFEQRFGYALLVLLIIGLFGYTLWRLVQTIRDPDGHGRSLKGLSIRFALAISAVTHALLAFWTIALISGLGDYQTSVSANLLASDIGPFLFAVLGVAFAIVGAAHIYKGWSARFERYMNFPASTGVWARPVCRFGLIARGVAWCIIAWFLFDTATKAKQDDMQGIADALSALQQAAYGAWLLLIVATGLVAFGIYSCLEGLYRRIQTRSYPSPEPS